MMEEDVSDSNNTDSDDDYGHEDEIKNDENPKPSMVSMPTEEERQQAFLSTYEKGSALAPSHTYNLSTFAQLV
jgi:hypothetical protein